MRTFRTQVKKDPPIILHFYPAPHTLKDILGSVLKGKMKMRANLRARGDKITQVSIQKPGIERAQPNSPQPLDVLDFPEQTDKGFCWFQVSSVGTKMNAGQDDLPESLFGEASDLLDDFFWSETHAPAPYVGNNTKTAPEITPVLNLHQRAGSVMLELHLFWGSHASRDSFRQIFFFPISHDLPNLRVVPKVLYIPLCIASRKDQPGFWIVTGDPVQKAAYIPVCLTSKGAGVHHDDVASSHIRLEVQTAALEVLHPGKCFSLVDPASEGSDRKRRHILSWIFWEANSTSSAIFFL
jgi:hypothetical protein